MSVAYKNRAAAVFEEKAHLYSYDPETGFISRRGKRVGAFVNQAGYYCLHIRAGHLRTHRVAWFLHHGAWPSGEIDHINGDRLDNRIANLRDVCPSQNRMNQAMRSDNTTGVTGVSWLRRSNEWVAHICVRGCRMRLGTFLSKEDAVRARMDAQRKLGFGPNHGSLRNA